MKRQASVTVPVPGSLLPTSTSLRRVRLHVEPDAIVPLRPEPLHDSVVQPASVAVAPMWRVDEQRPDAAGEGIAYGERHDHAVQLDHPTATGVLESVDYLVVGNGQRRQAIFRDGTPHPK